MTISHKNVIHTLILCYFFLFSSCLVLFQSGMWRRYFPSLYKEDHIIIQAGRDIVRGLSFGLIILCPDTDTHPPCLTTATLSDAAPVVHAKSGICGGGKQMTSQSASSPLPSSLHWPNWPMPLLLHYVLVVDLHKQLTVDKFHMFR